MAGLMWLIKTAALRTSCASRGKTAQKDCGTGADARGPAPEPQNIDSGRDPSNVHPGTVGKPCRNGCPRESLADAVEDRSVRNRRSGVGRVFLPDRDIEQQNKARKGPFAAVFLP